MATPDGTLEIVPATAVAQEALAAFYGRINPPKAQFRAANWRWLYRLSSAESVSPPLLALLDGKIIGHAGLIPVRLRSGGEERTAIWFVDFWILPEHQRGGIGTKLTRAWMSLCPLHITFCNERSLGVFLKLGWSSHRDTRGLRLLLRPERHALFQQPYRRLPAAAAGAVVRALLRARARGIERPTVTPVSDVELAAFEGGFDPQMHVPRTLDWLRWRLLANPAASEHLVFRAGRHAAVAHVVERPDYRRLNLLAFAGDKTDTRGLTGLVAGIVGWADRGAMDDVCYVTNDAVMARTLQWWLPLPSRLQFAMHANDTDSRAFLERRAQRWETIDSDLDLAQISTPRR